VRLADSGDLYLEVAPNRSKRWFWKYYFDGKEKRIALGHYVDAGSTAVRVNLKVAREARDEACKLLRGGTDPAQHRQLEKLNKQTIADATFASVARELHATKSGAWGPRYFERWIERMEKDLFPWIGTLPLSQISAPLLLHTLRRAALELSRCCPNVQETFARWSGPRSILTEGCGVFRRPR
jgi:Arm DNA-binding domain